MLQNIRDKTHGWFTRVVFGLVCLAFILWGTHSMFNSSGPSGGAPATVNGKEITVNEVGHSYQRLLQERRMQLGNKFKLDEKIQLRLQQIALQKLIVSAALVQSAEDAGLRYTPTQVGHLVSGISAFQQNGRFSPAKFAQALDNLGFTPNSFFDSIRDAMLINQLRFGIIASSFALPYEVDETTQLLNQKRDIVYTIIPKNKAIDKVVVTEDEIKHYYAEHQQRFTMPAVVTVQYIEVSLPEFAKTVSVSDDELLKFYQSNTEAQKKPFDQMKSSLRMRVAEQKSLQSFSDAVDKLTNLTYTNPQSLAAAATALHLSIQTSPPLTKQRLIEGLFANEALKSAVFSSEVLAGNNSSPINLDDKHAVVVHLLNQTPQMVKPLAEVRDEIINILKLQKAESVATDSAQTLVANILSGASLVDLAKQKGLQVIQQNNLARFNSGKDAFIFNEAFQLPRPAKQNSAGMFRLPSSDIAVIQVLQVKSVGQSGLQKIEQNVASEKIENAYAQLAYDLYANGVLNDSKIAINKNVDKNHDN